MNEEEEEILNVQQIRFANGTEVLANLCKWDDEEFIEANCILEIERRSLDVEFESDEGRSFYVLKPWVSYIDDMHKMTSINPVSIVSVTTPAPIVVEQYGTSLTEIIRYMDETSEEKNDAEVSKVETQTDNVFHLTPKKTIQLLTED